MRDLLRFITCGSVDDGKSTLIGRLLLDAGAVFEDQLAALERDSRRFGTTGDALDLALLVDGLAAEREQGITIDVAHRYFATPRRAFIIADTPGHEQYTRNMATGASQAELAVILVDARKGILPQTRRHSLIASLFGIRDVVLAVNKMDLVEAPEAAFRRIVKEYEEFARNLALDTLRPIPLSALRGDNVVRRGARFPWHDGPTLLDHLETVAVRRDLGAAPFRLPVQWVNRPNADFRGYSGTLASGRLRVGDDVVALPSGRRSSVGAILAPDGDRQEAVAGEAVTVRLADQIDVSRGDVLAPAGDPPEMADQFAARLLWMHESPLIPNRDYAIRIGTRFVAATVTDIKHKTDIATFQHLAAKVLRMNEVATVNLSTREPVVFDSYAANRTTGAFVVVDRLTNDTVGAGMIEFALKRATNILWQAIDITRSLRAELKGQRPAVLWFTGLSGAGKSTLANLVEKRLFALGRHTYILDGDNVRHGLNRDLGFTEADRVENVRRVAETAKLFADAGLIVLCSFISPFRAERRMARELMPEGEFVEIFVDAPLSVAEARDPKGLYRKARRGELRNFTGIDSPYEAPEAPELRLATADADPAALADDVVDYLRRHRHLD